MLLKKVTKFKIGSNGFNLTKKWFHSTKTSNQSLMFLFIFIFLHIKFSCCDNITGRNSKPKCYKELHLNKYIGRPNTSVTSIFMQGGRKSDIMDVLY